MKIKSLMVCGLLSSLLFSLAAKADDAACQQAFNASSASDSCYLDSTRINSNGSCSLTVRCPDKNNDGTYYNRITPIEYTFYLDEVAHLGNEDGKLQAGYPTREEAVQARRAEAASSRRAAYSVEVSYSLKPDAINSFDTVAGDSFGNEE